MNMSSDNHYEKVVMRHKEAESSRVPYLDARAKAINKSQQLALGASLANEYNLRCNDGVNPKELWSASGLRETKEFLDFIGSLATPELPHPGAVILRDVHNASTWSTHAYPIAYSYELQWGLLENAKSSTGAAPDDLSKDVFLCEDGLIRKTSHRLTLDERANYTRPVFGSWEVRQWEDTEHYTHISGRAEFPMSRQVPRYSMRFSADAATRGAEVPALRQALEEQAINAQNTVDRFGPISGDFAEKLGVFLKRS